MIGCASIAVRRAGRTLLRDVSLSLRPGAVTVVIGPNGAGKSTLLKVLSGELLPDEGRVFYDGTDLSRFTPPELARRRAVLPQSTALAFPFTVLEVVRMGAVAQGALRPDEAARKALAKVGLAGFEGRAYTMLSGGEQQRVQFARTLAQLPDPVDGASSRVLLLDEPTSSLDLGHQIAVLETARDFAAAGGTVLAILHDLNLAAEFADHLVVLHRGGVVASGPAHSTIDDPTIASVYGIAGAVGRLPPGRMAYVLPQARHSR